LVGSPAELGALRGVNPSLLVDTDVLVDYLRGRPEAVELVLGNADAIAVPTIVAATALGRGLRLITLNVRHYPMCPGLEPAYQRR